MAVIKEDLDIMINVPDGFDARKFNYTQHYLLGIINVLALSSPSTMNA